MALAARTYDFRARGPFEGVQSYRAALIAHVEPRDFALAHELRTGRRQADWTPEDVAAFRSHLFDTDHHPPREFLPPASALAIVTSGPYPVGEAVLEELARNGLEAYKTMKCEKRHETPPIIVSALLTDGRLLVTSVSRGDRVAVLKTMARDLPLFGFFVANDVFIHSLPEEGQPGPAQKCEALVMHIGTRDRRLMLVRPYRLVDGRVTFDDPPPDLDKRGPETLSDPYAGVFAQAPQTTRTQ